MKNYDILAIGDTVVDAFIRLKDAKVHCDIDDANCTISMRWGDKIPFESATIVAGVGNSANAAVSAAKLGLQSALLTHVGKDTHGDDCITSLKEQGVDTSFVFQDEGIPTNYHYVLWFGAERTILVKHADFPYTIPKDMPVPSWLYLSSLGENTEKFHDEIAGYLEAHPEVSLAFQPGTFQMKLGKDRLARIYAHARVAVVNKEEAAKILEIQSTDIKELLTAFRNLGPKIAVITDGPKGAYAYDGENIFHVPAYPDPKDPVDRTGAGDAFASTFVALLARGMSIENALLRAPINSMSVVQNIGAQRGLLTEEALNQYLEKAPSDYIVEKM